MTQSGGKDRLWCVDGQQSKNFTDCPEFSTSEKKYIDMVGNRWRKIGKKANESLTVYHNWKHRYLRLFYFNDTNYSVV